MRRLLDFILLVLAFWGTAFSYTPAAAGENHPFRTGEKMDFVLKYSGISAGAATLEVHDMVQIDGVEAYHFVVTARSNSFVDIFFKVRDRIDSYADAGMNHSLIYKKDQEEGKTRRKITVDFDWAENKSTYVNFDSNPKVINLIPGTFDPLSVFYYSRLFDFQNTKEFENPVTDGEKNLMGVLRVIGRETVSVPAGTFQTLVLEPDMKDIEGVFAKKQRAKIRLWITDDADRLLVQMKSKAIVGSFVAELVAVEGHDSENVGSLQTR
jgi:hypothetical protein